MNARDILIFKVGIALNQFHFYFVHYILMVSYAFKKFSFVSEWQLLKKIQKNTLRYRLLSRLPFPIISTKFSNKDKGDNSWLQIKHKKKTYILRYVDAEKKIFPHPIIS